MARIINRLRPAQLKSLPAGLHADGNGLYLFVSDSGAKSWRLILNFKQKRCEIGLGSLAAVSLADARAKRDEALKLRQQGEDPRQVSRRRDSRESLITFGSVARNFIAIHEPTWKNAKHRDQWKSLEQQAAIIWNKPVADIEVTDVLETLRPIWTTKPETASRIRGRIEQILSAAKAQKLRSGENPAVWRGNLDQLLPRPKKGPVRHHPAMPYDDAPAFYSRLQELNSSSANALRFTILTAARTGETIGATWKEIDLERGLWVIPASRMKVAKEHRVPLSHAAVELLEACKGDKDPDDFIFPGARLGAPLSNMSMTMVLGRLGLRKFTVHGFRSTFRDWAGDKTDYAREVVEEALAHTVGSAVERAYRRGHALEKRSALMNDWAHFLS